MALTGSWNHIWQEATGEIETHTVYYPLTDSSSLPPLTGSDANLRYTAGTSESIQVSASADVSQSYDGVYVKIQGATVYYPGEESDGNFGMELNAVYRVYPSKEVAFNSGSAIHMGVMDPIEWSFDTMTNPFEQAYDTLKTYPGFENLSDC